MIPTDIHQRVIAHPAFQCFPASVMTLWLRGATAHRINAGESWNDQSAHPDRVDMFIPDDDKLALQLAGLESLLDEQDVRVDLNAGANGWLVQLPAGAIREAIRHDAAIRNGLARWIAAPLSPLSPLPPLPPNPAPARNGNSRNPYEWLGAIAL